MKKKESCNFFRLKNPAISRWSVVKGGEIAEYASVDDLYASLKKVDAIFSGFNIQTLWG